MRLNLSEDDDRSFELMPSARYRVRVSDYQSRETRGDGKLGKVPMLNWEYTVLSDYKTGDTTYAGRKLFQPALLVQGYLGNLKDLMRASGKYSQEELKSNDLEFQADDIVGVEVLAVVTQREYQGDLVNDVKRILPLDAGDQPEASLLPS